MLVLITYDVSTETSKGRKRLRKVSKICVDYGQRVQNSVFECVLDNAQALVVKQKLIEIINPEEDSIRFYYLGKNYSGKVEHIGVKSSYDAEGPLVV